MWGIGVKTYIKNRESRDMNGAELVCRFTSDAFRHLSHLIARKTYPPGVFRIGDGIEWDGMGSV